MTHLTPLIPSFNNQQNLKGLLLQKDILPFIIFNLLKCICWYATDVCNVEGWFEHVSPVRQVSLASRPALDAWFGAREWALRNPAEDQGWISRQDYEENGGEYLKEHCASNIFIPMKLNKPTSTTKHVIMGKFPDTSLPDTISNDNDNDISLS